MLVEQKLKKIKKSKKLKNFKASFKGLKFPILEGNWFHFRTLFKIKDLLLHFVFVLFFITIWFVLLFCPALWRLVNILKFSDVSQCLISSGSFIRLTLQIKNSAGRIWSLMKRSIEWSSFCRKNEILFRSYFACLCDLFFAVRVWRNTLLKEGWESTTDLKTSISAFKGIWFFTRYKERIALAILLKTDFQRLSLDQFPDYDKHELAW